MLGRFDKGGEDLVGDGLDLVQALDPGNILLACATHLRKLEYALVYQCAEVEEGAHSIGYGDVRAPCDRAIFAAQLDRFAEQVLPVGVIIERAQEEIQQAAPELAVAFARVLVEVLVPGQRLDCPIATCEAYSPQDALHEQLRRRIRLRLRLLAQTGLDIRAPKAPVSTTRPARGQFVAISPLPHRCGMHTKHVGCLAQTQPLFSRLR